MGLDYINFRIICIELIIKLMEADKISRKGDVERQEERAQENVLKGYLRMIQKTEKEWSAGRKRSKRKQCHKSLGKRRHPV